MTRVGAGRPVLILHGGGGPLTVLPWGTGFAAARNAEVIVVVHPGFDGTPRPESLRTPHGLAELYVRMLDTLELEGVTVVGNSIGGWIAAEIAALGSSRVSGVVLVDAVGLAVSGHPYPDFFSLTSTEVAARSYHDPERFGVDPSKLRPGRVTGPLSRCLAAICPTQPSRADCRASRSPCSSCGEPPTA